MSDNGYEILTAANADAALELVKQDSAIQLLLSDIMLPGNLNGLQLANLVSDFNPGMKIVLMTGYVSDIVDLNNDRFKSWPLLRKPFSNNQLASAVKEALAT